VAPSFLLACVLWSDVRDGWARRIGEKQHPYPALQDAIDSVFDARIGDVSGRGKLAADMREVWMMQPRFDKRTGSSPFSLVEQPRFRAAFDFMRLRADVGEVDVVLVDWWQEFSQASEATREDLLAQLRVEQQRGARRVRAVRPPAKAPGHAEAEGAPAASGAGEAATDGEAPRKRRRRRRKPTGGGQDAAPSPASD
jgi:poly(A) polymerase